MLPGTVTRVRHCAGGNYVDVFGTITAFSEWIAPQNLVKAEPILSDPLES